MVGDTKGVLTKLLLSFLWKRAACLENVPIESRHEFDWRRWFDLLEKNYLEAVSRLSSALVAEKKAAAFFSFEDLNTQLKANLVIIRSWRQVVKRKRISKRRNESKSIINQNKLSDSSSTPEFQLLCRWKKKWFADATESVWQHGKVSKLFDEVMKFVIK